MCVILILDYYVVAIDISSLFPAWCSSQLLKHCGVQVLVESFRASWCWLSLHLYHVHVIIDYWFHFLFTPWSMRNIRCSKYGQWIKCRLTLMLGPSSPKLGGSRKKKKYPNKLKGSKQFPFSCRGDFFPCAWDLKYVISRHDPYLYFTIQKGLLRIA